MSKLVKSMKMDNSDDSKKKIPIVSKWLSKFKLNKLCANDFHSYWEDVVPRIFTPSHIMSDNSLKRTKLIKKEQQLFNSLEKFICGGNNVKLLHDLRQRNSSVCGRIFNIAETTYSCQECEMHDTCALCVKCFNKSAHKNHRFKITPAFEGGTCDCGNIEAWKNEAHCEIHQLGLKKKHASLLKNDIEKRAYIAFEYILLYAYEVLFQHRAIMDEFNDVNDTYFLLFENDKGITCNEVQSLCLSMVGFSNQEHIRFVTRILQQSRVIATWGSMDHCMNLLNLNPKIANNFFDVSVKKSIVNSRLIARQTYVLKLLNWMQQILECSEHLRAIFSKVVFAPKDSKDCILKNIFKNNSRLWKSARIQWYNLITTGMFMEFERKKEFSVFFIDNYDLIVKNFIDHDYDFSYSIASFGVQIFTSPRISNYLMVHHDVLHKMLSTFLSLCAPIVNKENKLEISENLTTPWPFKRATRVLDDVRYLLDCIPNTNVWNTKLRKLFCRAISLLIDVFSWIENTDILYEPLNTAINHNPCELAFQLYYKLKPITEKILLLCESDSIILKSLYRTSLIKIMNNPIVNPNKPTEVKRLLVFKANCITYDISSKPVSVHFPLTRFFGALSLCIKNFGVGFKHNMWPPVQQSIVQIIERILRVIVFIAQLNAGMWLYNETLLTLQIHLYTSDPNYRTGMFDKDIVILQIGASLIDSNKFLIHLLNKFNLLTWVDPESMVLKGTDEELLKLYVLIKEFLTLIVIIVGERFTPKVGQVTYHDCIKKEVIQQLCVSPMSHSQLKNELKNIIKDNRCLDKAIDEVAVVKTNGGNRIYKLKPIYYNDYNVFYYHYSKEQMCMSENNQIQLRKEAGELQCCPPPSLPLFSEAFANINNIMQCTIMFQIIVSILNKPLEFSNKLFGFDIHLILHLIGYALREEEKQSNSSFTFTKRSKYFGLEEALNELQHNPAAKAYKDIIIWTLNKFRQVSALNSKDERTKDVVNYEPTIELKKQRSKLIAERRAAIITQMTQMQNNFIKDNALLFENVTSKGKNFVTEKIGDFSIAVGPNQTTSMTCDNMYTCMLCQEEQLITYNSKTLILTALIQNSSVLCQVSQSNICTKYFPEQYYIPANFGPSPHISTCGHVMHITCWEDYIVTTTRKKKALEKLKINDFKNEYLCPLCESICNTVIPLLPSISSFTKLDVKKTFNKNTFNWLKELKKALNQINVDHSTSSLTPNRGSSLDLQHSTMQIENYLLEEIGSQHVETEVPESIQFSIDASDFYNSFPTPPLGVPKSSVNASKVPSISTNLVNTILKFVENTYSKATYVDKPHSNNNQTPLMTWKACAYTIHSIEVFLRYTNKSLLGDLSFQQKGCLEALVRISGILSSTLNNDREFNLHAFRLLSIAINNGGNNSIGILDWDAFGMLVSLTMTMPSLYYTKQHFPTARGTILDLHILSLMFIANIVQIILTIDIKQDPENFLEITAKEVEDTRCIADLVYKLRGIRVKNTIAIWNSIQSCTIPFLRCCSLFYNFLTEVPASAVLTKDNGDTYYNMCCYLGLPTSCKKLLDKPYVKMLINKWTENEKLIKIKRGEKIEFRVWKHINELVKLPNDYSELINIASMSRCQNDHDDISRNPTMCLVCGKIFCCHLNCSKSKIHNVSNHL